MHSNLALKPDEAFPTQNRGGNASLVCDFAWQTECALPAAKLRLTDNTDITAEKTSTQIVPPNTGNLSGAYQKPDGLISA
jgi:hypothetical protein